MGSRIADFLIDGGKHSNMVRQFFDEADLKDAAQKLPRGEVLTPTKRIETRGSARYTHTSNRQADSDKAIRINK